VITATTVFMPWQYEQKLSCPEAGFAGRELCALFIS
jgi:hypothetical protein